MRRRAGQGEEGRGGPFGTAGAPGAGNRAPGTPGRRAGWEWWRFSGVSERGCPGEPGGRRVGDRAAPPPPPLAGSVSRLPLGAGPLWGRGPCAFLAGILEDRFDRAPCATRHATFRRSPHPDGHLWVTNLCGLRCPTEAPAVCWDLTRGRPTRHLGPSVWPRAEDGRKEAGPQGGRCGTCPSDILNGSARLTSHAFPKANSGCFVKIRTTQ